MGGVEALGKNGVEGNPLGLETGQAMEPDDALDVTSKAWR